MNKKAKNIIWQIAGKKNKGIYIIFWVSFVMYIVLPMLIGIFDGHAGTSVFTDIFDTGLTFAVFLFFCELSGVAFFATVVLYLARVYPAKKSVRTLIDTNKLDYADEILSGNYNSNGTVGFSRHLLYDERNNILVAYDDIVWVYETEKRKRSAIVFCTIDGRNHKSIIDHLTLNEFLKRRSGILKGFNLQNKMAYENKVKEYKLQKS